MAKEKKKKTNDVNFATDFANLASHQLRTPLSGMKWMLELLQNPRTGSLNRKQKEFLDKIYFLNERMTNLVNDLLEVSRVDQGETKLYLQPTDLTSIIRSLLKEKKRDIERKELDVVFTVEHEPFPVVRTEASKIKQAINNLLNNALAYTPDKGKIVIQLRLSEKDKKNLQCSIADTGMGIPKDQQSLVFSKFFRGSNVSKVESVGTGLGLYIAKAFIEASGGKIWFTSIPGKGSTFYFTLPIVP